MQKMNGADFQRLMISAAAAVELNKQALNELNVFPVPDGDTGTNMSMTIHAAAVDLRKLENPTLERLLRQRLLLCCGALVVIPVLFCLCWCVVLPSG